MNPAQRLILRVLYGPANFINNNLAKRPGLFGRIGRFWSFGIREYGVHPTSKMLRFLNSKYMYCIHLIFSRQPLIKTLNMKHNQVNGYFSGLRIVYYFYGYVLLSMPFVLLSLHHYKRESFYLTNSNSI